MTDQGEPPPPTPAAPTERTASKKKSVSQKAALKRKLDAARGETRVNIGSSFERWRRLMRLHPELKGDEMVAEFLLDSYEKTRTSLQRESTSSSLHYERGHQSYTTHTESEVTSPEDSFEEMEVTIDEDDCNAMKYTEFETSEVRAELADDNSDEDVYLPLIPQRSTMSELLLECEEEELEPWQKQTVQLQLKAEEDFGELSNDQTDHKPEPSLLQGNVVDTSPPELKTEAPEHVVLNSQVKMYCPVCGFKMENLSKVCSSCGRNISCVIEDASSVSRTAGEEHESSQTVSRVTDACNAAAKSSIQFMKYRELKEREKKKFSKSKHKLKTTVKIYVGIMNKTKKNDIKPVRGKTLPLHVVPQWSSKQLLTAAVKKLKGFNQDTEDGEYVLLYPDGSQIKTLPGTDTPFTIKHYKEAIGKGYHRITFYICTLGALLSKTKSADQIRREMEKETFSQSKKTSKNTVKICVGIMSMTKKNGIQPVRGKTLPLHVEPQWSSEQLLAAAVKKLKGFNQDTEDEDYVLLYPDGSQIKTLPGTDKPFTIKHYKEAVGKGYHRITFYICTLGALLSKTKSADQIRRETEKETFSQSKKTSKNTVKIYVGIMSMTKKNGIQPVRGKTLPLHVEPQWSSEQLLAAAVKKLKGFNQDREDEDYVLLYPDGSQIKTVPGTDKSFTIKHYKEAIGKDYQRITFYICAPGALLSKNKYSNRVH